MFMSLTVQFIYIKNVFTVNDFKTICCNLSRKAIGKEFDMPKSKIPESRKYSFQISHYTTKH